MIIDCGQCAVRGTACAGCAVTSVTASRGKLELDAAEARALAALADAGMIPPVRYAPPLRRARPMAKAS